MQRENLEEIIKICEESTLSYFKIVNSDEEVSFKKYAGIYEDEEDDNNRKPDLFPSNNKFIQEENQKNQEQGASGRIEDTAVKLTAVLSNFVGIVTLSDTVKEKKKGILVGKGDVLCVIEAMKIYNDVSSPVNGTIEEVLISDGEMVEFGQELLRIKEAD